MPLFYIHKAGQEPVRPLSRKFRVREVLPNEKLDKTTAPHSEVQADFSQVLAKTKPKEDNEKQQSQQQEAAEAYRSTYKSSQSNEQQSLGLVRDIMSSPVLTILESQTLDEAWRMMQKYEIHHLAIIDDEGLFCGLLSEKVILPYLMQHKTAPELLPLSRFCSQAPLSTSPDTSIKKLVPALLEYGLDGIVVTENGILSGIATYSDILKVVLKLQAFDTQA